MNSVTIPWNVVSELNDGRVRRMTHKVIVSSLQPKEEVGVGLLGHIRNCAVGKDQVEADNGVNRKTVLIALVGVPYW